MISRLDADWLEAPALVAVFDALERDGDTVRAVGGAVRNTLLGLPVSDIDLATTALPEQVVERARAAGLKPVPTGIDHGTVTVVSDGQPFEVTTLREDVETHGRAATVRFGRNWEHDAARRDFTMNALYVDRHGVLHDPLKGLGDLRDRRVRFIGDPHRRIQEDYLRILRFFRFHASYGAGTPDAEGLAAAVAEQEGLSLLSAERVGQEMRKLVTAPGALTTLQVMARSGILEVVLGSPADLATFAALRGFDALAQETRAPALCLAALAGRGNLEGIAGRLRLSNAERERMFAAARVAEDPVARMIVTMSASAEEAAFLLEAHGREASVDGVLLASARWLSMPEAETLRLLRETPVPEFPLKGRDLLEAGLAAGPEVGARLERARSAWRDSGFTLTRDDLLAQALAPAS
jgi:poly(A) polymerase